MYRQETISDLQNVRMKLLGHSYHPITEYIIAIVVKPIDFVNLYKIKYNDFLG